MKINDEGANMFSRKIKSCSDSNTNTSAGGYEFTLFSEKKLKNIFKERFYISVWVIGFYEYECHPEYDVDLEAKTEIEALKKFKDYIKNRYGDAYGTVINCD